MAGALMCLLHHPLRQTLEAPPCERLPRLPCQLFLVASSFSLLRDERRRGQASACGLNCARAACSQVATTLRNHHAFGTFQAPSPPPRTGASRYSLSSTYGAWMARLKFRKGQLSLVDYIVFPVAAALTLYQASYVLGGRPADGTGNTGSSHRTRFLLDDLKASSAPSTKAPSTSEPSK